MLHYGERHDSRGALDPIPVARDARGWELTSERYCISRRFVYKFVCDLKNLLGYSAGELSRLVLEAEETANDAEQATN